VCVRERREGVNVGERKGKGCVGGGGGWRRVGVCVGEIRKGVCEREGTKYEKER